MKWFFPIAAALLLMFTVRFWLPVGVPYTHDGENHLARFANYKVAVREGQIPPRFAPNLLNHYGYPVFNYNYPLANILSLPFSFVHLSYETTYKLIVLGSLLVGSIGVFYWLRLYTDKKKTISLGLAAFLSGPPLVSTLFFRGSIGEIMAYSLWPWVFFTLERLRKKVSGRQQLCIIAIWTAFLLAHNISVLVAAYLLPPFFIWLLLKQKNRWLYLKQVGIAGLAAVALSAWFWIPAVMELGAVITTSAENQRAFLFHFPTLSQLVYSPLTFGYSYPGPVDTLSFWLGSAFVTVVFLLVTVGMARFWLLWRQKQTHPAVGRFLPYILLLIVLVLLQLPLTTSVWKLLPAAALIQFPWRLGLITTIVLLPLLVFLYDRGGKIVRVLLVLSVLVQVLALVNLIPIDRVHKQNIEYELHGGTTSTLNENRSKDFFYLLIGDWQPSPTILSGTAEIDSVEIWNGRVHQYRINVFEPSTIVEPTMQFLGWQTQTRSVLFGESVWNTIAYTNNDEIQGRIAYQLAPGLYQVRTTFTQFTPARLIGNGISAVAFVALGASTFVVHHVRRKKK